MLLTINGKVVETPNAKHPVLAREFLRQDGIFETLRVYAGNPFKLEDHIARFTGAANKTGIALGLDVAMLVRAEVERAQKSGLANALLRITLTRQHTSRESMLVTLIDALPKLETSWYSTGVRAVVATERRNEFAQTSGMKTTATLDSILSFRANEVPGEDDQIFLDTEGHLSEATASNIFLYSDGTLMTPPVTCGALPGITRATVKSIAGAAGIPVIDNRPIHPEEIGAVSEVFLTSSVREIVPVVRVGEQEVGTGVPGPVYAWIMNAYSGLTA